MSYNMHPLFELMCSEIEDIIYTGKHAISIEVCSDSCFKILSPDFAQMIIEYKCPIVKRTRKRNVKTRELKPTKKDYLPLFETICNTVESFLEEHSFPISIGITNPFSYTINSALFHCDYPLLGKPCEMPKFRPAGHSKRTTEEVIRWEYKYLESLDISEEELLQSLVGGKISDLCF